MLNLCMEQHPQTKNIQPKSQIKTKTRDFPKSFGINEKNKKGSKNFRKVFQFKQTLNLPNFTSWQTCLDDPSIEIADVNKSLHWLSKAELSQDDIDRKQTTL